jgi:hypothetical protein
MSRGGGGGQVWCNNCASGCATDGCYDTCGSNDVLWAFVFVAILVACAGAVAGLVFLALCARGHLFKSNHNVQGRVWTVIGLMAGGIPQLVVQYYGVFHRRVYGQGEQVPPCIGSSLSIGLWTSGFDRVATGDFLSVCTGSHGLGMIQGIRATSLLALLSAVAACYCLVAHPSAIPSFVLVGAHFALLVATALLAETLWATDDFCHSGRSLKGLLFDKGAAIGAMYAAMAFAAVGVAITAAIRVCRPDCFDPLPESEARATEFERVQGDSSSGHSDDDAAPDTYSCAADSHRDAAVAEEEAP